MIKHLKEKVGILFHSNACLIWFLTWLLENDFQKIYLDVKHASVAALELEVQSGGVGGLGSDIDVHVLAVVHTTDGGVGRGGGSGGNVKPVLVADASLEVKKWD